MDAVSMATHLGRATAANAGGKLKWRSSSVTINRGNNLHPSFSDRRFSIISN